MATVSLDFIVILLTRIIAIEESLPLEIRGEVPAAHVATCIFYRGTILLQLWSQSWECQTGGA